MHINPINPVNTVMPVKQATDEAENKRKSVFAGDMNNTAENNPLSPAEKKRELAREKARHIIEQAFKIHGGLMDARDELRAKNDKMHSENSEALEKINELEKEKEEKLKYYSDEATVKGIKESYAEQEAPHIVSIIENKKKINDNIEGIDILNKAIAKDDSMVKASDEADKIMADADSTLMRDIIKNSFKEYEEKTKDETEKLEELKEERKAHEEELEEIKNTAEESKDPEIEKLETQTVESQLTELFNEMGLSLDYNEDLKGLIIDAIK